MCGRTGKRPDIDPVRCRGGRPDGRVALGNGGDNCTRDGWRRRSGGFHPHLQRPLPPRTPARGGAVTARLPLRGSSARQPRVGTSRACGRMPGRARQRSPAYAATATFTCGFTDSGHAARREPARKATAGGSPYGHRGCSAATAYQFDGHSRSGARATAAAVVFRSGARAAMGRRHRNDESTLDGTARVEQRC